MKHLRTSKRTDPSHNTALAHRRKLLGHGEADGRAA